MKITETYYLIMIIYLIANINSQNITFDPCIYVNSSSYNSTIDTCLNAGNNCCAFKWSYIIEMNSSTGQNFITCVNRNTLLQYSGADFIEKYLSGIDDPTVYKTIKANGIQLFGCNTSSFMRLSLITLSTLLILIVI